MRIKNVYITDGLKAVPLNALPEEAWTFITGEGTDAKELKKHYESVPWLYRGVNIRAQAVASVPFSIMDSSGKEIDTSDNYQNKLGWLPDPYSMLSGIESDLTLFSRAYLLKNKNIFNRPLADGLRRFAPRTIRPKFDGERGIIGFTRMVNNKQLPMLSVDDVVYIWLLDPFSELGKARSPAEASLNAAGMLLSVDEFGTSYFKRGAVKVTLLAVSGAINPQDRSELEGWWKQIVSGVKNAFGGKVINADRVTPTTIGDGLAELANQNLTKEKREDIATALGIPQSILFSTGGVNRAITQQDAINFYSMTIVPEAQMIERSLNTQLFKPLKLQWKFQPQKMSIFQIDETNRSLALLNLVQAGEMLENAYLILGYDLPDEMTDRQRDKQPVVLPSSNGKTKHLEQWQRKSLNQLTKGLPFTGFDSDLIPETLNAAIRGQLEEVKSEDDLKAVFDHMVWSDYP